MSDKVRSGRYFDRRLRLAICAGVLAAMAGASVPAWADTAQKNSTRFVDEAKVFMTRGQLKEAELQLKNALRDDPKNLDARITLGMVALRSGDAGGAERSFKTALQQGGPRPDVLPLLGQSYLMQGKSRDVLAELTVDNLEPPIAAQIADLRARAYLSQKNLKEAMMEADAALALQPEMPEALLTLATLRRQLGDNVGAEALVDRALAAAPKETTALDAKGDLRALQDDAQGALDAFQRSLAEKPDGVGARLGEASAFLALGDVEKARQDVDGLLKRFPGQPKGLYLRAFILDRDGSHADALAVLEPAAPNLNDFYPAQMMLGQLNLRANRLDKAQGYAQRALVLAPTSMGAKLLLGLAYSRQDQPQKVVELLEPIAAQAPQNANIARILGNAYGRVGRFDAASKSLLVASLKSPESADLRVRLAASRMGAGDHEEGLGDLNALLQADPQAKQAGVLLISSMINLGRLADAQKVARDLRVTQPENPLIDNLLGRIHWMMGDWNAATTDFESALRKQPTFLDAAMNLVLLRQIKGEPDQAESLYAAILKNDPKNAAAMVAQAGAAQIGGHEDNAVSWLEKASGTAPNSFEIRVQLIELLIAQKKIQKALATAQALARTGQGRPEIVNALARAQLAAGQQDEAIISFQQLAALQPNPAIGQFQLGQTLALLGRHDDALLAYRQAVENDPRFLPAWQALVATTAQTADLDRALTVVKGAMEQKSIAPYGDLLKGEAYLAVKRYDDAETAFRAALKQVPDIRIMTRLVEANSQAGDTKDKASVLADWLKSHPDDAGVRNSYADALMANQDHAAAKREYRTLLDLNPIDVAVLNNLAWLHEAGEPETAMTYANRAFGLAPQSAQVRDTLAWIMLKQGNVAKAKILLRLARAQMPDDPEINYHLAAALAQDGDTKGARELLQPLSASSVSFASQDEAKKLLVKLGPND